MSMSRKDYENIAAVLDGHRGICDNDTLELVAHGLAEVFRRDNPRFITERFLEACGVE